MNRDHMEREGGRERERKSERERERGRCQGGKGRRIREALELCRDRSPATLILVF